MIGIVEAGWGAAATEVPTIDSALLPWVPYPGTLNVRLRDPAEWPSPAHGTIPWFGYAQDWRHAAVNGIPCVVIGVAPVMPAGHKLELLAATGLRDALAVGNGDHVSIVPEVPCVA